MDKLDDSFEELFDLDEHGEDIVQYVMDYLMSEKAHIKDGKLTKMPATEFDTIH